MIASACQGTGSERSASLPAVAPFDSLTGINLPTTVRELAKARPGHIRSSFGLHEILGGIDVRYFAERAPGSEEFPAPQARVEDIEAVWGRITDDSAATLWGLYRGRLTEILHVSPECFRDPSSPVAFARWRTSSGTLAHLRRQHSVTGPIREPAAFTLGFSVDTTLLRVVLGGKAVTSCDDPFRLLDSSGSRTARD